MVKTEIQVIYQVVNQGEEGDITDDRMQGYTVRWTDSTEELKVPIVSWEFFVLDWKIFSERNGALNFCNMISLFNLVSKEYYMHMF